MTQTSTPKINETRTSVGSERIRSGCPASYHSPACECVTPDLPFGEMVPLTRVAVWHDGERQAASVYVNRRNVAYCVGGRNSTTIHLVGGGTLDVTESLREVVAACS